MGLLNTKASHIIRPGSRSPFVHVAHGYKVHFTTSRLASIDPSVAHVCLTRQGLIIGSTGTDDGGLSTSQKS